MTGDKTSSAVHAETICATCGHVAGAGEAGRFCPIDGRALIPRDVAERYPDDAFLGRILLGRYAVVDRIEDRGEGRRYRAIQRPGNHQVCVEVIDVSQHGDVSKLRTRFMNRAKLVGRLTHTSLVKVADYWVEADESQFLVVSELVEGVTLRQLLDREGPLSAERVTGLVEPVLGALAEAHELDIPHGHLRPEVLLVDTTEPSQLRVLDFGLSDAVRTDPGGQSRPRPEADLTAIGRLLYEMLTGLVPVDGDTPTDEDALRMPPVLNVPRPVQRVVARAVVGQNQFETAKALAQALREALTAPLDEPTPAPVDEPPEGPPAELSNPDEPKIELAAKDEVPPIVLSVPPDELAPEVIPPPKVVEPPVVSGEPARSELESAPTPATADDLETFPTESDDEDFELPARRGWLFVVVVLAVIAGAVFWYLQRTSKPESANSATQVTSTPTQPVTENVTAKPDPAIDHGTPVADQGNLRDQQVDANAVEDQGTRKATAKVRAKRASKKAAPVEVPKAERPDQLDRTAFMAVIGPMRARMTACQPIGPAGKVEIGVTIQPSGRVSQVTVDSPLVKSKRVQQCMRDLVIGLAFPEFQGPAAQHTVKCRVGARKKRGTADHAMRPDKLTKAQVMSVVRQHSRAMLGCKASVNDTGEVKVTLVIEPDGKVGGTKVTASTLQHPATARCVREKVSGFQFPQFKGPPMKLTLPFRL